MLLTKQKYGRSSEKIEELEAVQQEMDELLAQLEAAMDSRTEERSLETITIDNIPAAVVTPGVTLFLIP
jgi:hypothetical protein